MSPETGSISPQCDWFGRRPDGGTRGRLGAAVSGITTAVVASVGISRAPPWLVPLRAERRTHCLGATCCAQGARQENSSRPPSSATPRTSPPAGLVSMRSVTRAAG